MQVKSRVDLILTKAQFPINTVLDARSFKFQNVPSIQRHDPVVGQGIERFVFRYCCTLPTFLLLLGQSLLDQAYTRLSA